MRITCESCKASFELDDSRISDDVAKARCSKCNHVFMVRREEPDALHSESETELGDSEGSQTEHTENVAPTGEEVVTTSVEQSDRTPEEPADIPLEELIEKKEEALQPGQSEPSGLEDLSSSGFDIPDEPEKSVAKESDSQPLSASKSSKAMRAGVTRLFGRNRDRIVLSLVSAVLGGIVVTLLFTFVMTLSGGNIWARTPKDAPSQPVDVELLEDRVNGRISLLNRRYEELQTRVSQAARRIGELEVKLPELAKSQKNNPPKHESVEGNVSMKEVKRIPRDDSSTLSAGHARSLYQDAYKNYEKGHYRGAIAGFQELSEAYPSDDLADNALYWIGESYYAQKNFKDAIANFMKVVEKYPQRNKVPDALLKIGFSYSNLSEEQKTREFLTQVMDNYPFSEAATKASMRLQKYTKNKRVRP